MLAFSYHFFMRVWQMQNLVLQCMMHSLYTVTLH